MFPKNIPHLVYSHNTYLTSFLICSLSKSFRYNHAGWLGLKFQLFISTLKTCFQSYNWKEETGGLENAETDLTYCSLVAVAAVYDCFEHLYQLWLWLLSSKTDSSVLIDFPGLGVTLGCTTTIHLPHSAGCQQHPSIESWCDPPRWLTLVHSGQSLKWCQWATYCDPFPADLVSVHWTFWYDVASLLGRVIAFVYIWLESLNRLSWVRGNPGMHNHHTPTTFSRVPGTSLGRIFVWTVTVTHTRTLRTIS